MFTRSAGKLSLDPYRGAPTGEWRSAGKLSLDPYRGAPPGVCRSAGKLSLDLYRGAPPGVWRSVGKLSLYPYRGAPTGPDTENLDLKDFSLDFARTIPHPTCFFEESPMLSVGWS